ncbi:hypothetical protein F443_08228 [Phytophthora nicotianae P1569]|uniref:Uncharacterized protein n=1 Tax=Phytophthora nicotianae P1569 TaxID=1317065 RepID=V9FB28_PHYNI|nr:hypothetical protein F443_08228 [Phytophthora nicotianae P1569]
MKNGERETRHDGERFGEAEISNSEAAKYHGDEDCEDVVDPDESQESEDLGIVEQKLINPREFEDYTADRSRSGMKDSWVT